ncbi:hypothetical protein V2I01_29380 [Micromonospora sp. BRA006-A]|nr:hypothetical protein [Micromonospora sp. BRA006-A]
MTFEDLRFRAEGYPRGRAASSGNKRSIWPGGMSRTAPTSWSRP